MEYYLIKEIDLAANRATSDSPVTCIFSFFRYKIMVGVIRLISGC